MITVNNSDISIMLLTFSYPEVFTCPLYYTGPASDQVKGRKMCQRSADALKHKIHRHPSFTKKLV